MGDLSTHAILYSGYWHLARKEGDEWVNTQREFEPICDLGAEQSILELKREQ